MANLSFREYKKGDEYQILRLFKQVFNRDMGIDYWNWRFRSNVQGEMQVDLAFDSGKLIGHSALSPVKMIFNNKVTLAGLSNNTMTHPGYRGMGIYSSLANKTYDRAKNANIEFVWAFPNQNSYSIRIHRLGFLPVKDIPALTLSEQNLKHFNFIQPKRKVEAIDYFDPAIDDLWKRLRDEFASCFGYFVVRNSKYLNWRYVQNPRYQYKIFCIREGDGYLGYIVTKFYSGGEQLVGDIVDIFCIFDKDIFLSLIYQSISYLSQNASQICCWMNENYQLYKYLEEVGFTESSFVTHFVVKPLSLLAITKQDQLVDYSNWYISMGDSDVY